MACIFDTYLYDIFLRDLSKDEEFVDDLKSSLRFLASVVLRRAKKVSVVECFISFLQKVMHCG